MSSRVEGPRSGAPIGVGRHKQDHERRNQELQKRAIDVPLSKSFTEDPHDRARKRSSMAGKSFMKSTSSSSMKKTMEQRDASPPKAKKRDPTNVMSKSDHQVELRKSSSRKSVDNKNRLSVFERLAKTDLNKEQTNKAEDQMSKSMERGKGVDKNSAKRKSGVFSDTSVAATVPLRRDSNVRRSSRASGKRDSKADISEKYKSEEKPESSDKDAKEECKAIKANDSQHVALDPVGHVGTTTTATTHKPLMGGENNAGVAVAGSGSLMPVGVAAVGPVQAPSGRTSARTTPPSHTQQKAKRPPAKPDTNKAKSKDTHKAVTATNKPTTGKATAAAANKPTTGKAPILGAKPEATTHVQPRPAKKISASAIEKPPKSKTQKHTAPVDSKVSSPSVEAVSRLAERVTTGQVKPNKADADKVLDDDKDVCDDDKASEDREFYRIKVQTRLVSYENNTLVIKNTSKVAGVSDEEDTGEPEQYHESCNADTEGGSLQTSSAEAPPVGGNQLAPPMLEEEDEAHEEEEGGFTRSRSLRLKMSQFVNKGKNFLSDVYSSTHQSLQPHLSQLPEMTRSFQQKMSRSMTSECSSDAMSIMSFGSSISYYDDRGDTNSMKIPATDTDSGFYSIHTTPDEGHTPLPDTDLEETGVEINNNSDVLNYVSDEGDIYVLTNPLHSEDDDVQGAPDEVVECTDTTPDGDAASNNPINDDWVKRCIVSCSCQCPRPAKDLVSPSEGSIDSGHGSDVSIDCSSDTKGIGVIPSGTTGSTDDISGAGTHATDASGADAAPPVDDSSITRGECQCECHGGTTPAESEHQIPQEVMELLDADHARMWWTITGNFGNILPIDWSKTYTRQQYLPVLNLNEAKDVCNNESDEGEGGEEEDVAQDLDLHHLILSGLNEEPVKSADEVIREIDDIMQEGSSSEDEGLEETMSCSTESKSTNPEMRPLPPPLYEEKLKNLSVNELNEHYMELEVVIRQYSETLINQLALRDELEYEKELKNSFISLLLQVQNKRRNFNVEKKQKKKYLTTVIPYDVGHGPPSNQTLQILIKILTAINEDSPTVPTLLTDYILKVLCPT